MNAKLVRWPSTSQGTAGILTFGSSAVKTMELPWLDNMRQRSCIPVGRYTCAWIRSPRFGLTYGLLAVPGRANVLIHAANFAGDVDQGYTTELHGCIAPCRRVGQMRNMAGKMQLAGLVSKPALMELNAWAGGKDFELEIVWESSLQS